MPDGEDERRQYDPAFFDDLGVIKRDFRADALQIALALSDAVDLLVMIPRPPDLPIDVYEEDEQIWQYQFFPGFVFTYWAYEEEDPISGKPVRFYNILRVLRKRK